MKKKNTIWLSLLLTFLLILEVFPTINTYAMDVSFAVSPSKIYDEQIDLGASKSYEFYVVNKSTGANNDFTITTDISGTIENEYGETLENNGVITFDVEKITLGLEEIQKVTATVNIPKDYEIGNYKMYIDFTQEPVPGFTLGDQTNVIRVPVYIFAGDESEYSQKNVDFDIIDSYLSFDGEPTTILKESVKDCIKVLNPLKAPSVIHDIINRPVFNFKNKKEQRIDLNNDIYTDLKKVATTSKKLTDTKYVYYEKDWLNKKLKNCENKKSYLNITLEDDNILAIEGEPSSIEYVYSQLQTMAQNNKNLTLQDLFNNLQVPKNYTYAKTNPILVSEVKSTSDIPITLKGKYKTIKNNVDEIKSDDIISPTISKDETVKVQNVIADKDLEKGSYNVSGTLTVRDKTKDFNYNFRIVKLRTIVLIIVIIFLILYIALAIFIVVFIIRFIKKKLKEKKEKDKQYKENADMQDAVENTKKEKDNTENS